MEQELGMERTPWEKVQIARSSTRPYAQDYINEVFDQFMKNASMLFEKYNTNID